MNKLNRFQLFGKLLQPGRYLLKRQSQNPDYRHALYEGNMLLLELVHDKVYRQIRHMLRLTKGREVLDKRVIRSLHGNNTFKKIYKKYKNGTQNNNAK